MDRAIDALVLGIWIATWGVGGVLLAGHLFRLRTTETGLVGFGIGLVTQVWLANVLARLAPVSWAFWLSAGFVLAAGMVVAVRSGWQLRLDHRISLWILLAALTLLFYAIGQGLAIFDDYQNLPTVSLMAAGDIPPHFALNPELRFGYHYLLLLFAAELMRLGHLLPWRALDLARAFMLSLPIILAGLWSYRIVPKKGWAIASACVFTFVGGSRWLLLLLPRPWLDWISRQVTLIGSAASSAPTLAQAMISTWKIDGAGPLPFPFAFYSGVNQPLVMAHTGIAGSGVLILLLLLFSAQRWMNRWGMVLSIVLLAALAMANEILFLLIGLGLIIVALARMLGGRKPRTDPRLLDWLLSGALAVLIASMQGGMLTEMLWSRIHPDAAVASYFDPSPSLVWPPAIVSAHLGSLSTASIGQLLAALLEIGPIVLVFPLVYAWGIKSLRLAKWFEAALVASSAGVVLALFLSFKGPLFTAAPRLMGGWFLACALYFVPLVLRWLEKRSAVARMLAIAAGSCACFGGAILFGMQLSAIQRPVNATFISDIDASVTERQWNELPAGVLIFDPVVYRAPTVFGRPTRSSASWYTLFDTWEQLRASPDPYKLNAAGFDYAYFGRDYWDSLSAGSQATLTAPCARQLWQVDGIHSETDYTKDFRRLLDIRACR